MTAKKGDIVFVTQDHYAKPVAAVVMENVTNIDQVVVHVLSSSDPYARSTVKHRVYFDQPGYLEADEPEPDQATPPPVDNDHVEEGAELFGTDSNQSEPSNDMPEVDVVASRDHVSEVDPTDSGEDSAPSGESDPDEEEEEEDESEEDESSSAAAEGDQDGQPVSAPRRKRGKGRKR